MATDNQLRARLDAKQDDSLSSIKSEKSVSRAEAERIVIEEGLESLGYLEKPTEPHEILLYYVERMGLVLGFVGLIMIGYGVFGPRSWSFIGFGITLGGFLLVAVKTFLDAYVPVSEEVSTDGEN